MSIPVDSPWRGCAANFPQPVSGNDLLAAQNLVETVHYFNCRGVNPLPDIVYRSSSGENDILRHVFRWDLTPYQEVFQYGFHARRQESVADEVYFNLDHYIHHGGRPLDSRQPATHAFVSTTLNSNWNPTVDPGDEIEVYRYEIYAPGGIWVAETLGDRYQYPRQDEVCFIAGIAPQYIRSAQLFRLSAPDDSRFTRRERVNNVIIVNGNYNPQSHPPRLLNIRRPVFVYQRPNRTTVPLSIIIHGLPRSEREIQQGLTASEIMKWYADEDEDADAVNVGNNKSYINAAFRSSTENRAYLFMNNEYVCVDYAPGTNGDRVVFAPILICHGYPSLKGTAFAEHGIDCAFGSHDRDEAFIFSGNLCAKMNYAPGTTDDKIIKGPMTITAMFPFFKGTVFESGIDAAFEATTKYEAYLFKGNQYALINYNVPTLRFIVNPITDGFASLRNTIFESGIDAAFSSHRTNEAYLFKGDSYARINFAPGTTNDYIIGGVHKIVDYWPSLSNILPRSNRGIDVHDYTIPDGDRDHDEL